ncbi:hypothetical protein K488DRAFT_33419, partial [Vararia minispora EC-137]
WSLYLSEVEKTDKKLTERWKSETDAILIFTGLFAATVATFVVIAYPSLSPNGTADTITLLQTISSQLAGGQDTALPSALPSESFQVPLSTLRINIVWFLSLLICLCCALAATLVQRWTRGYLADAYPGSAPCKRGPVHAYLRVGIERFGLARAVDCIITLLHISVFLFVAGLVEFTFTLSLSLAYILYGMTIASVFTYLGLTVLPVFYPDCPYDTP